MTMTLVSPHEQMAPEPFAKAWANNSVIAQTMEFIATWYAQTKSSRGRGPTRAAQINAKFGMRAQTIQRWRKWRRGLSRGRRRFLFGPAPIRWRDLPRSVRTTVERRMVVVVQTEEARARARRENCASVVAAMDSTARRAGLSRVTLYRRLRRFRQFGPAGLIDQRAMQLPPLGRRNVGPFVLESARARTGVAG